jgi:hypothetical protein
VTFKKLSQTRSQPKFINFNYRAKQNSILVNAEPKEKEPRQNRRGSINAGYKFYQSLLTL